LESLTLNTGVLMKRLLLAMLLTMAWIGPARAELVNCPARGFFVQETGRCWRYIFTEDLIMSAYVVSTVRMGPDESTNLFLLSLDDVLVIENLVEKDYDQGLMLCNAESSVSDNRVYVTPVYLELWRKGTGLVDKFYLKGRVMDNDGSAGVHNMAATLGGDFLVLSNYKVYVAVSEMMQEFRQGKVPEPEGLPKLPPLPGSEGNETEDNSTRMFEPPLGDLTPLTQ